MSEFLTELLYVNTGIKTPKGNPVYKLTAPLKYQSKILANEPLLGDIYDGGLVVVPAGFKSDFATIPLPISRFIRPNGPWKRAAVVHDFLIREIIRKVADDVFYEALRADGINKVLAYTFWFYVRLVSNIKGL